jgi:hypothetical protein
MPLFLDIYFTYWSRYNMEVDEETSDTYNILVWVCLWFCRLDVVFFDYFILILKGTVRPDWICMRVVSLESPLKGHQPL